MGKKNIFYLIIVLLTLSFIYGVMVGALKYPPYKPLETSYKLLTNSYDKYERFYPEYLNINVSPLILIENEYDAIEKRNMLIQYIWKNSGFPAWIPNIIEKDIKDERYSNLNNLKSVDKITIDMDYGLNSIVYHFHPVKANNKLAIYHQGHDGDFILGKGIINSLLNKGYSVMAFSMPLLGMNNQPTVDFPRFGKIKMINHQALWFLESDSFSPIKFFVEPVAASLNYANKNFSYSSISMIGFSGGGWTATLYSAIDTRIIKSYTVSGTLPIYLNTLPPNIEIPHYERSAPELYRIANYLELYILGSYGDNRKQLQILNKYDKRGGLGYLTYEKEVKKIISNLGKGEFEVYLDDTHKEHKISDNALNIILNDLES